MMRLILCTFALTLTLTLTLTTAQQSKSASGEKEAASNEQFVWDLLKPPLRSSEVEQLLASKDYPTINEIPEDAFSFDCSSKNQPGFYADIKHNCQVFHRCDNQGNHTAYLCVNTTVFNQITLVCDFWFNVDCASSTKFENFANSRLYTDLPLFDTPPANYIPPGYGAADILATQGQGQGQGQSEGQSKATTTPKAKKTATTTPQAQQQ